MEKLVPKLRFPGIEDIEYKNYSFEDIFLFSTGKNIKFNEASTKYETPCVRYGELYHMYNEVIYEVINKTNLDKSELIFSEGNEILLPSAGEDPLDIGSASALTVKNVAIGRTINILKPKDQDIYSPIYVSYYINKKLKKKIASLAKGVSISNVYNSDLKTLKIKLPSLKEQQKIASFLTTVDERITLLEKQKQGLETYKKGVMQQLFSQQLRFKDDKGKDFPDWEEKKLGDEVLITKGQQLNKETLSLEGNYPCQNGGIEPSGYTDNFNAYENTITISEGGNSCGYVNYMSTKFWCGGHCYTLTDVKLENKFLYQYLKYHQEQIMNLRVGSGLPNIQKSTLSSFKIHKPCLEEQKKIASFLSAIDARIEVVSKQIEQSKVFKKGLLQQLFV